MSSSRKRSSTFHKALHEKQIIISVHDPARFSSSPTRMTLSDEESNVSSIASTTEPKHMYVCMFSLLKLKAFYLTLKLRAYLLTHHSHDPSRHSKINVLLLKEFHFTKSPKICPFHLFLQSKAKLITQVLKIPSHLFTHALPQHLNFHSSQSSST